MGNKPAAVLEGTFTGHTAAVWDVCWVGGDRIVSASGDRTLKLWSVSEQRLLGTFEGHTDAVNAVAGLEDGRIASGSSDGTVKIWDIETRACLQTLRGHGDPVLCAAVLGDGRLATGSWDRTVKVWSVGTGACLGTCKGHTSWVWSVAGLEDGRIVSASKDTTLKLWDDVTQACLGTFTGHTDTIRHVVSVGGGRIVSSSSDGTLKLWNVDSQACLGTFRGHTGGVFGVAVLGHDKIISSGGDKTLRVWDVNTQTCCNTFSIDQADWSVGLLVQPDRRVITVSGAKSLQLWNLGYKPEAAGTESKKSKPITVAPPPPVPTPPLAPVTAPITPPTALPLPPEDDLVLLRQELSQRRRELDDANSKLQQLEQANEQSRARFEAQASNMASQQRALDQSTAVAATLQRHLLAVEQRFAESRTAYENLQAELDHVRRRAPFSDANDAMATQSAGMTSARGLIICLIRLTEVNRTLRLEPVDRLGEGRFGVVFSARIAGSDGNAQFALKRLALRAELSGGKTETEVEHEVMHEAQLLMNVVHPNIVQYHTIYLFESADPMLPKIVTRFICIGMDLCKGGTLASLAFVPDAATLRDICLQTMLGLAVLHNRVPAIRHGDLKPENICLVSPLGSGPVHVKLIDFGLADDSTLATLSSVTGGSIAFWSPERLSRSGYNIEDDVWAAALSLLYVGVGLCSSAKIASDLGRWSSGHAEYQPRIQEHLAKLRTTHGNGLASVLSACLIWERKQRCSARAAFIVLNDMKEP